MRFVSPFFMLSFLATAGCGSMFSGPAPDMAALPPPGAAPGHYSHNSHRSTHHRHASGTSYADDAPVMPMPPGAESPPSASHDTASSASPGSVSFGGGQGNSVNIAPQPATPDTEVSYGQNNASN
ncbi:hypothetical protein JK191_03040 [Gluconobacter sphaericus]|nr:hypothetical protein [Gluconobacter sphaericus]QQX92299.1 hypothetical protein IGS75_04445 [Gluconobacter sphaericus]